MLLDKIKKENADIVFVYTICRGANEARSMGFRAVESKLAISVDYWMINSIYPWQGVVKEVGQYLLMFSTKDDLSDKLIKHIEAEHSYKVPMIAKCNIATTNIPYSLWVCNTLESDEKYLTESEVKSKDKESHYGKLK